MRDAAAAAAAAAHADAVTKEPVRLVVVVERDLLGAAELRRLLSAPANGAAPATPRGCRCRAPPDRTPLRDVVAMCLDDWEVRSDTSDEASDDFCAWRVRRRAEPLPSGRGRAQSAPPQPQRARSVLDAARASTESRGRTFRESCVLQ